MSTTLGCVLLGCKESATVSQHVAAFASRHLAGKPLVHWVVRRATEAQRLDNVVVVVAQGSDEDRLRESVPPDVEIFVSSAKDALGQICDFLDHYTADAIVRVPIESPLVDPSLIDRLITAVDDDASADYATFCSAGGRAVMQAHLGLIAEYCRASALRLANRKATGAGDRENPTRYIQSHPEHYSLRLLPVPRALDRDDLRLSIRNQDDWDHAEQIVEALGNDELDWQQIAQLLEQHPDLRKRMADLNRQELSST